MAESKNLTKEERDLFISKDLHEEIPSINRRIGKRLKHREEKWTTLGTEYQNQIQPTSKVEGDDKQGTRPKPPQHPKDKSTKTTMPEPASHSVEKSAKSKMNQGHANKIVLLGPEGAGKSALGNLLVGKETFTVATTSGSGPTGCMNDIMTDDGEEWEVVDTPGSPFVKGSKSNSIKEIEEEVKKATIIIFVLNTSHKRTPDMGIKAFKRVLPTEVLKPCMLVATHGDTHYRMKGTAQLLADLKESPAITTFLQSISDHAVIVELGDGQQSEEAKLDGEAVYEKEIRQARQMVMTMVKHLTQILPMTNVYPYDEGKDKGKYTMDC